MQPYLPTVPPTFDEPATDDTDPTWSFPPTIWDATGQQEPLTPELQCPDAYVRSLMVERDALALPELRLLFQAAPMPAARREAVQTALNALWPLEWDWTDLGTKGVPLRGKGRTWLELGKTIDRRKERIAAVWRAVERSPV